MKYKVGDRVRVIEDLVVGECYGIYFQECMRTDEIITITKVIKKSCYETNFKSLIYSEQMLDLIEPIREKSLIFTVKIDFNNDFEDSNNEEVLINIMDALKKQLNGTFIAPHKFKEVKKEVLTKVITVLDEKGGGYSFDTFGHETTEI